ncbi:hypothetical protein C5E41_01510 [Nocardia nova]|nr:hypothetical protein C5E41_01510 [Nocardia nova]
MIASSSHKSARITSATAAFVPPSHDPPQRPARTAWATELPARHTFASATGEHLATAAPRHAGILLWRNHFRLSYA